MITFTSSILTSFRINEDVFCSLQTSGYPGTKLHSLLLYADVKAGFVQKVCRSAPHFVTMCLCSSTKSTKQVGEKLLSELVKNTEMYQMEGKRRRKRRRGKRTVK